MVIASYRSYIVLKCYLPAVLRSLILAKAIVRNARALSMPKIYAVESSVLFGGFQAVFRHAMFVYMPKM